MLGSRVLEAELMDQPGLNVGEHVRALRGLGRVNSWSRTAHILWDQIRLASRRYHRRQMRILDLACGGGDVTQEIARLARGSRFRVTIHGWDKSETAIAYARQQANDRQLSDVHFFCQNVLSESFSDSYDVIMSTLFLHHLDDRQAESLLRRMAESARCTVLIDDLLRSRWGLLLARVGCRVLSRSPVVHVDGPLSVRSAFQEHEVRSLARRAGLSPITFRRHWPERFLLSWNRP